MKVQTPKRLQFVSGKGGVGKSTVACALAQYWLQRQKSVLLVQTRALDSHSKVLQIPQVHSTISDLGGGLSTVNLDPLLCLQEYLRLKTPLPLVSSLVLRPSVLSTIIDFVPGLSELAMLGKIIFHLEETDQDGRPKFDCIIVDLPATGHAIKMLGIAKSTQSLVKRGRVAADAAHMDTLLCDPNLCAVHLVTLLDDLPIQELTQAVIEFQKAGFIRIGTLFVNRMRTHFTEVEQEALEQPQSDPILESVRELWIEEQAKEEKWLKRLRIDYAALPIQIFPELLSSQFGPQQLQQLVGHLSDV